MRAIRTVLGMTILIGVLAIVMSLSADGSEGEMVEVTFEEGITVVYDDRSEPGPWYTQYELEESPSLVNDINNIWAVPNMDRYGDVYINGAFLGNGVMAHVGDYPQGIHFEVFRSDYVIEFDSNSGVGEEESSIETLKNGDSYTIPSVSFSRDGYNATIWNTEPDGTGTDISPGNYSMSLEFMRANYSLEDNSVTLYPKWIPIQFSFVFNSNGGSGDIPNTLFNKTIETGVTIPSINISRTGYYSVVWNTSSNGNGFDVSPGFNTITSGFIDGCFDSNTNVTLYPKWIQYQYSFTFYMDGDGETPDPLSNFTIGSVVTIPATTFTKTGYTMAEWNTSSEGSGRSFEGGQLEIDSDIIEDLFSSEFSVRLYSIWNPIQYTISFNANGGSGDLPDTMSGITISSNVSIPTVSITRTGYSSTVWNTAPDGSGDDFNPQTRQVSVNFINEYYAQGTSLALYPKWVARHYSISFYMDGDGIVPASINNITIGSTVPIPPATFTKTGYTMAEWNTSSEGSGRSFGGGNLSVDSALIEDIFSSSQNIQLFSIWDPIEYSVTFNINGGTGNLPENISGKTILTGATAPSISLSRVGYSITVWNTSNDGSGTDVSPGTNMLTAGSITALFGQNTSITLYPKWSANRYSLSFVMDGDGVAPGPINNFTIDSSITIPAVTFTKTGYSMTGWNSRSDGSGHQFSGGNLNVDADIIQSLYPEGFEAQLFSVWTPISYSILFDRNNGVGNVPGTMNGRTIQTGANVPDVSLSKIGYSVQKWNTSSDGTGSDIDPGTNLLTARSITDNFGQDTSITLYPKWIANRYSLSFVMDGDGVTPSPINNFTIDSVIPIPATTFTKTGYTMSGWNSLENGSGTMIDGGNLTVDSDIIQSLYPEGLEAQLFSVWTPTSYSILFNRNGGNGDTPETLNSRTIQTGANVPDISLSKIGYSVQKWNTSSDGTGSDIDPGTNLLTARSITDNFGQDTSITLYPKWIANRYSLSFVMDGDGTSPGPINNIVIDSTITIPTETFTKTGYDMVCWNSSQDGSGRSFFGGNLILDAGVIQDVFGDSSEARLYSIWSPKSYSVVFNANNGVGNVPEMLYGRTITTPTPIPSVGLSRIGYSSSTWNTSPDGSGLDVNPGTNVMTAGFINDNLTDNTSLTLYPKWVERSYSISFRMDGDGSSPDPINNITIDSFITIPSAEYNKTGYDMVCWNSSEDGSGRRFTGGSVRVDSEFLENIFVSGTEARLYSIWDPKVYSVMLITERGTVSGEPWTTDDDAFIARYTIESDGITLPEPECDDRFHSFAGWKDGNGNPITGIDKGSTGNVYARAVWTSNSFSMNIIVNGKTMEGEYTVESTIPDPECEQGFSFKGWFYRDENGQEVQFNEMSQMEEGMSLYAVFEPVKDNPIEIIAFASVLLSIFGFAMYHSFFRRKV